MCLYVVGSRSGGGGVRIRGRVVTRLNNGGFEVVANTSFVTSNRSALVMGFGNSALTGVVCVALGTLSLCSIHVYGCHNVGIGSMSMSRGICDSVLYRVFRGTAKLHAELWEATQLTSDFTTLIGSGWSGPPSAPATRPGEQAITGIRHYL